MLQVRTRNDRATLVVQIIQPKSSFISYFGLIISLPFLKQDYVCTGLCVCLEASLRVGGGGGEVISVQLTGSTPAHTHNTENTPSTHTLPFSLIPPSPYLGQISNLSSLAGPFL